MAPKFDFLEVVKVNRESYRFRVRVIMKWFVPGFINPDQPMSMELILMDEKFDTIQATVRKSVMYKFSVYRMSNFGVLHNTGSYRTTAHQFKLLFQLRTTVSAADCVGIPLHGIKPVPLDIISRMERDSDYLIDVVGLMTGLSADREYLRDGKVTKMVVIELTDTVGKVECTLFGDFVDQIKTFLKNGHFLAPMVVLQYAKMKIYKGKPVVQNTLYASRLLINPDDADVKEMRNRLSSTGIDVDVKCESFTEKPRMSIEDEYLKMYPKKTAAQLIDNPEVLYQFVVLKGPIYLQLMASLLLAPVL